MSIENLTSGLIGAVVGIAGAFVLQWNETRKGDRAAARIVFLEVVANRAPLSLAVTSGVYAPLFTSAWTVSQEQLSRTLSPRELVTVTKFYLLLEMIIGRAFAVSGAPSIKLQMVAGAAVALSQPAAAVLESRGWWPWERRALRRALKDLKDVAT